MLALQLLTNGLALGAAYALVALGFVLIVNATGAVNFAQGDMVVAGGFLAVALFSVPPFAGSAMPGLVVLPIVLVVMAAFGLVFSLLAYVPLRHRPPTSVFISTIALGIMMQNALHGLFGPAPRAGPAMFGGGRVEIAGFALDRQALAVIITAAGVIAVLQFLFTRTQFGRRLRAAAQDPEMARAMGIPVDRLIAVTFALAAALAGVAGLLLANRFFVTPEAGGNLMIKAYIAVVIGGWGSIPGAVLGAMLIALFEVGVAAWISYPAAEAGLYLALMVILVLRPRGLLGERLGRRA